MEYETARVAIDVVILTVKDGVLQVYLNTREKEPQKDYLELPGGLLTKNETAEQTLKRKLSKILDYEDIFFQEFEVFTTPNRDPRTRTISIGYLALINQEKITASKNWYVYSDLKKLAFDHEEIILKAIFYLKKNLNSKIIKEFLPKYFPINRLQEIYELIEEQTYDNRNFRKRIISAGIVLETNNKETNVSHRPAKLYYFNK
ncbi:MAG: NUDIX domain-containing protein [Nanoarchaeota archaeon]|nr:hypothetical protein [Nanoarchaeota archaeon]MBU1030929.1 hypothetical protein [Nanoarchaeota archaeon]MBU1850470.1 hypothetical protein [Nanoarchaeota archaeon]